MHEPETVSALGDHPFFRSMRPELLAKLASCAQWVTVTAGQHLGREQDSAQAFYLIRSGRVAIEVQAAERSPVRLQTLGPGEIVGWSWLVPPHRWQFDALVVDAVQLLVLDAVRLRRLCEEDTELGYQLLQRLVRVVAHRLAATRRQLLSSLK
jgi:CRP-like cAMP-binding protein